MRGLLCVIIFFGLRAASFGGDYFSCKEINYFSDGCSKTEQKDPRDDVRQHGSKPQVRPEENIWAEPTMSSDGTFAYKVPPLPVMYLLDDPSPENAQRYLDWSAERSLRINRAMEAVQDLTTRKSGMSPKDILQVAFFFQPDCSYSRMQGPLMQQFAQKVGKDKVTGYAMAVKSGESVRKFIAETGIDFRVVPGDEFGTANNVTGWPTIIVKNVFGKSVRLDGFTESIDAALLVPADAQVEGTVASKQQTQCSATAQK